MESSESHACSEIQSGLDGRSGKLFGDEPVRNQAQLDPGAEEAVRLLDLRPSIGFRTETNEGYGQCSPSPRRVARAFGRVR